MSRLNARYGVEHFVGYFQPGTNTYGPVDEVERVFREALEHPQVLGLMIGTRPDCLGEEMVDLLARLAEDTWVSCEIGLQTMHERTLRWMNRGHGYQAFVDAVERSRNRGFEVGAHVILGLPDESHEEMMATAREIARLGVDSVKIHNLHAVKNTALADMVSRGEVRLPEFEEYVGWVVDFLEILPVDCVIDRISGDAPRQYLVGPEWCLDKTAVRQAVEAEFRRRGTRQGAKLHEG